jgi:putative two-component system response regulator
VQRSVQEAPIAQAAKRLADSIEKKDRYTAGHSKRVAWFAARIASFLDDSTPEFCERVRIAALLHDVGKIGIGDEILKKKAALDDAEWSVMRTHPELAFEFLAQEMPSADVQEVIDGARFHHERWDGKGYPQGLRGEEIPWLARIVAVADAYDAMISTRPYRPGMGADLARKEIMRGRGTQFDPRVVDAFALAFEVVPG